MWIPWSILIAGLVIVFLSIPMILRRVPRNEFYGLRTKRTMNGSEEDWYAANHRAGVALCVAGLVTIAASLVLPLLHLNRSATGLLCTAVLLVSVAIGIYFSLRKLPSAR